MTDPIKSDFDQVRAMRLVADAVGLISSFYPDGALGWLRENRPDVMRYLTAAEIALDMAIVNENGPELTVALEKYVQYHQRAFKVFETRPPVAEVQTDMFAGAA